MDHLKLVIIKLPKVVSLKVEWSNSESLYYSNINYVPYKLHLVLLFCFNYYALNLWLMLDIFNTVCHLWTLIK